MIVNGLSLNGADFNAITCDLWCSGCMGAILPDEDGMVRMKRTPDFNNAVWHSHCHDDFVARKLDVDPLQQQIAKANELKEKRAIFTEKSEERRKERDRLLNHARSVSRDRHAKVMNQAASADGPSGTDDQGLDDPMTITEDDEGECFSLCV